jgi:CubicO group peptidase (beta-lactamase class C family)
MGKLSVQDRMSKYLAGVPADKDAITLHMLLTHTAGFNGDLGGADDDAIARDALVKVVLASKLAHRPGETFEYSNEGFSLLAAIVERVSGVSYERFLHDELFTPAGMTRTGYLLAPYRDDELAVGYRADGTKWGLVYKRNWRSDGPGWYLTGNGGIQSTTGDMFKWHLALEGDAILPAAERTKLFTPVVPTPGGDRYAYGWGVEKTPRGTTVVSHNGGNGFYSADFRRYIDDHVVIITMGNAPTIPGAAIGVDRIEPLIFNPAAVTMPPATVTLPSKVLGDVAGSYTIDTGGRLRLEATPTGLRAESSEPRLLAILAGFTPPGGRFASLEEKTTTIVKASAKGDFQPAVDAFVGARTLPQVQAGQGAAWKQWTTDFGPFSRFDILGVRMNEGDPVVVVRLTFDHGTAIAQYAWGPRRLAGFLTGLQTPARDFIPASATSFVTFDYRNGAIVKIDLDETKRTATVTGAGVSVRASR